MSVEVINGPVPGQHGEPRDNRASGTDAPGELQRVQVVFHTWCDPGSQTLPDQDQDQPDPVPMIDDEQPGADPVAPLSDSRCRTTAQWTGLVIVAASVGAAMAADPGGTVLVGTFAGGVLLTVRCSWKCWLRQHNRRGPVDAGAVSIVRRGEIAGVVMVPASGA